MSSAWNTIILGRRGNGKTTLLEQTIIASVKCQNCTTTSNIVSGVNEPQGDHGII